MAEHVSTTHENPRRRPPKKRQASAAEEPVTEGVARPHLDDKGRLAIKEQLTAASDPMLKDDATVFLAKPIDTACALVEMGAYTKARERLKDASAAASIRLTALDGSQWTKRFAAARAAIEDALRNLPAQDAEFEVEEPKSELEVGQFDQEPHATEATVAIEVPAETTPKDVTVDIKRDFLAVAVKGHEKQPHAGAGVLYGHLSGAVEVDACAWTLDGEGEARTLTIQLEKSEAHPCWPKLLRDPVDYWKEDARSRVFRRRGLFDSSTRVEAHLDQGDSDFVPGGLSGMKLAETSPVWCTPEEAARVHAEHDAKTRGTPGGGGGPRQ